MTSGSISKWNIKEGDKFDVGTVICEVETDKATVSYDATDSGYLAKILVQAGEIEVVRSSDSLFISFIGLSTSYKWCKRFITLTNIYIIFIYIPF